MTKRKIQYWVIPPEADAEFVAQMEHVLETYEKPYNPAHPVVCMDEQPVQLVKETRKPIPATKHHARRVDYEYERNGTASIFMFAEPLAGWRQAITRPSCEHPHGMRIWGKWTNRRTRSSRPTARHGAGSLCCYKRRSGSS